MATSRVLLKLLFCYLFVSLVLGAAGWVFVGPRAFGFAAAIVFVSGLVSWIRLETRLVQFCRATEAPSPGLSHSYRRALEDAYLSGVPPELHVIPSPALQMLVARSLGGSGILLVSQGLLGLLSESELRAVLSRGARRAKRPDTAIRSIASWCALQLLGRAPSQWLSVSYEVAPDRAAPGSLTPHSLFVFLLVLPLIRFFQEMSLLHSIERLTAVDGASAPENWNEDWNSATHKIRRAIDTWRLTATPVRYPFL